MSFTNNTEFFKLIENLQAYQNEGLISSRVDMITKAERAMANLMEKIDELNTERAILLIRCILFPFAIKTLELRNEKLSMPMVDLITEWLNKKASQVPIEPLIKMLKMKDVYELKYLKVNDCIEKKFKLVKISKGQELIDLSYLFQLLSIKQNSNQRDNLIELIKKLIKHIDQDNETSKVFCGDLGDDAFNFEELWSLYFDPLIIENIINLKRDNAIGKMDLSLTSYQKFPVIVKWSDNLSGKVMMASYRRSRIDEILYFILKLLISKSKLHLFAQLDQVPYSRIGDSLKTLSDEKKSFMVSQLIKLMKNLSSLDPSEDFTREVYENVIKMADELKFVTEDRSFNIEIHDKVIAHPWLVQNKAVADFFKKTSDLILSDSELKDNWKSLIAQLKSTKTDLESVFALLYKKLITIKTRNIQTFEIFESLDWCKDLILNEHTCQKLIESKVLDQIALITPRRIFNSFLLFYNETFGSVSSISFLVVLSEVYEDPVALKLLKEEINDEDVKLIHQTIGDIYKTESFSDKICLFLIEVLTSYEHLIIKNPNLTQLFAAEEIFCILLSLFQRPKQNIDVYSSLLKFILRLVHQNVDNHRVISIFKAKIIDQPEIFGERITIDSLLLIFSLTDEAFSIRLIEAFLDLLDSSETTLNSVRKFFESIAECLSQNISKAMRVTLIKSLENNKERILRLLGYKELQSDGIRIVSYLLNLNQDELKKFSHLVISEEFKCNTDSSDFDDKSFFSVELDQKKISPNDANSSLSDAQKSQAVKSGIQYLEKLLEKEPLREKRSIVIDQSILAKSDYVMTETAKKNLDAILESHGNPILIEGISA